MRRLGITLHWLDGVQVVNRKHQLYALNVALLLFLNRAIYIT